MANRKKEVYKVKPLNENKKNIIAALIDEYNIEEVESSNLPEPVSVESNEEETELSKTTIALAISAGVAIGAGLYRGFKYLKNKYGDKEVKKPTFRKRLRLVTVDENGNIVDPEQPIN